MAVGIRREGDVDERERLAEQFERNRSQMHAIAYRMLGSVSESEDAVQEAWFRLQRTDSAVENLGGWLTTVVGRICIDMLRARASRREDYVGSWLPEPILTIGDGPDPEQEMLIADAVGLALLIVLETLTPSERLAFVLHDMFAVPFDEIAPIIDRTPVAARQLASRARRSVQGVARDGDHDTAEQRAVVQAFLAAARDGDFEALVAVLDPDVTFRLDSGPGTTRNARPPITGAAAVARQLLDRGARLASLATLARVNGGAGFFVGNPAKPAAVVGFTIANGRITDIDLVTDPNKLPRSNHDH
jgi:RNA polymerase sigma factor (sigma-70 family)